MSVIETSVVEELKVIMLPHLLLTLWIEFVIFYLMNYKSCGMVVSSVNLSASACMYY